MSELQGQHKELPMSSERRNVIIGWIFIGLLVVAGIFIARSQGLDSLEALQEAETVPVLERKTVSPCRTLLLASCRWCFLASSSS